MLEKDSDDNSENLLKNAMSGEVIFTGSRTQSMNMDEGSEEQIDQDKVVVSLEELKAEYTNVTKILPSDCYPLKLKLYIFINGTYIINQQKLKNILQQY